MQLSTFYIQFTENFYKNQRLRVAEVRSSESFWLTKIKNAAAGITISNPAAKKLAIILKAELLATSGERLAAKIRFEI